jgi:hypothetical protein
VSSTIVAGSETMAVTPPVGDGISRTCTPMRAARRPMTMKPSDRDMARPTSGGWARSSLASAIWSGVIPMPWSVTETT